MSKGQTKRIRIFAGPNGSGKTSLIRNFPTKIPLGVYVNADDIERELKEKKYLRFDSFNLKVTKQTFFDYFKTGSISKSVKGKTTINRRNTRVFNNRLSVLMSKMDSYIAADIASFIRTQLVNANKSFSFETVLSHPSKIDFINAARKKGYRIYLYYVVTESPEINISRVKLRVAQSGHNVSAEKIKARYYKSLELLLDLIKLSHRAYLFDNSGKYAEMVAEITNGKKLEITDYDGKIPDWFDKYVYQKRKGKSK